MLSRRAVLLGAPGLLLARHAAALEAPADRTPWLLFPLYTEFIGVTSTFGPRTVRGRPDRHSGVDLAAPVGATVRAAREGTIVAIATGKRPGNYIKIEHLGGWTSIYCHLPDDVLKGPLKRGDPVRAWQPISAVGMSGNTYGPHLHLGVKNPNGGWEDPLKHLFTPHETWLRLRGQR